MTVISDASAQRMAINELRLMQMETHDHLVRVFDAYFSEGEEK